MALTTQETTSKGRKPFPKDQEAFAKDDRVAYSQEENNWILEEEDGSEWEWTEFTKRWVPVLSKDLYDQQQAAYKVEGVDEDEDAEPNKKRKMDDDDSAPVKKPRKKPATQRPNPARRNTAVYITSLPLNTTVEELNRIFSRYGVIAEELDSGEPRIKLYTDDKGKPKGDALIVYFRPESVDLAINIADDTDFRLGETGPTGKMRVIEADKSYKRQKDEDDDEQGIKEQKNGNEEVEKEEVKSKPKRKGPSKDQKKIIAKNQKMNSKLTDWSSDEDTSTLKTTSSRHDKTVYLHHMFTLSELRSDPAAILDIKEDVRDECSKLGPVTNCILYDLEEDGIVCVKFANATAAKECVKVMGGRHFGGLQVVARIADGGEKYRKSDGRGRAEEAEGSDGGEGRRLEEFGKFLDGGEDKEKAGANVKEGAAFGSNT